MSVSLLSATLLRIDRNDLHSCLVGLCIAAIAMWVYNLEPEIQDTAQDLDGIIDGQESMLGWDGACMDRSFVGSFNNCVANGRPNRSMLSSVAVEDPLQKSNSMRKSLAW